MGLIQSYGTVYTSRQKDQTVPLIRNGDVDGMRKRAFRKKSVTKVFFLMLQHLLLIIITLG